MSMNTEPHVIALLFDTDFSESVSHTYMLNKILNTDTRCGGKQPGAFYVAWYDTCMGEVLDS
jgi:hypothetical protein